VKTRREACIRGVDLVADVPEMRDQTAREIARWNRVIDTKDIERY
jgi:hypothetical protein